jgi:hypothetical protein
LRARRGKCVQPLGKQDRSKVQDVPSPTNVWGNKVFALQTIKDPLSVIGLGVPAAYFFEGLPDERTLDHGAKDPTLNVLNTNDGVRLAKAFAAIDDSKVRHRLVEMAEAIACLRKL